MTIDGKKRDAIVAMLSRRPLVSYQKIADFYQVSLTTVQRIAQATKTTAKGRPR